MGEIGNLSSASIPFALRAALEEGAIQPGDRILLSAFGVWSNFASLLSGDVRHIDALRAGLHSPLAAFPLFHFVAARAAA